VVVDNLDFSLFSTFLELAVVRVLVARMLFHLGRVSPLKRRREATREEDTR
jgi:hypothetical protein